jgi:hypothetical protein
MEIVRIFNGKLVEGWEGYGTMNMTQQLGLIPAPKAAEA